MSAFSILFVMSLFSFALHNLKILKRLSILVFGISFGLTLNHYQIPLMGFETSSSVELFEMVLFVVLGATVLSLDEHIAITQTLFLATASVLILESFTLVSFVISFEALSIISFVLVSYMKNDKEASGAIGMFISGSFATAIIMLGVAFYLLDGHSLTQKISVNVDGFGMLGLWIVLVGLFYKLTIVPMHSWALDSYAKVRPAYAGILSGIVKTVVFLATFKMFAPFIDANFAISSSILVTLALITMTLGNFLALFTKKVEQILSYSSIAHAGYMLLAFVSVKSSYAQSGLLYMAIAYIFMQTSVFLLLDKLSNGKGNLYLEDLKGLAQKDKLSALFLTIQLFSLAGIPLLAGFMGKAVLVYAVVDANFIFVALFTLLNSALSVGYYAWIVKHFYFDTKNNEEKVVTVSKPIYVSQTIFLVGTLYFGMFAFNVFGFSF